jgi:hypothetical protein
MFPETYGRTLEELAFLFEDRAFADEATKRVEKQMEWSSEQRWSRQDDTMSWDMDIMMPNKFDVRSEAGNCKKAGVERRSGENGVARDNEPVTSGQRQAIRGERGGLWES